MEIRTRQDASLILEAAARVYRKRSRLHVDTPVDPRFHKRDVEAVTKAWDMMVDRILDPPLPDEAAADLLREIEALKGESDG